MGFLSDLRDIGKGTASAGANIGGLLGDTLRGEQEEGAQKTIDAALAGQRLKREQFDLLREDIRPLRELRNANINRLLQLQGIGQDVDRSSFQRSPEFTTVRDAALQVQGATPGQTAELAERAEQLGQGAFGNFQNRIFNTAGFSSGGVGQTNRLLQQNVDAQTNLLNQAGTQAAGNLIAGAQQRGQAAGAGLGLLGALCDARLKANIRKIGEYDIGIGLYEWDWTPEALKLVGDQPSFGPMAHEVAEVMPDNVGVEDSYLYIKDMRLIH